MRNVVCKVCRMLNAAGQNAEHGWKNWCKIKQKLLYGKEGARLKSRGQQGWTKSVVRFKKEG